jgi:hypothetical protein
MVIRLTALSETPERAHHTRKLKLSFTTCCRLKIVVASRLIVFVIEIGVKMLLSIAALVGLYEESEKPHNALSFIQQFMSGEAPGSADVETLKAEIVELKMKNEEVSRRGLALYCAPQMATLFLTRHQLGFIAGFVENSTTVLSLSSCSESAYTNRWP